jgi:hypothetical protein
LQVQLSLRQVQQLLQVQPSLQLAFLRRQQLEQPLQQARP